MIGGLIRSSHRRCFIKKLILKRSQYLQENNWVGVSFLCFSVNIAKFLKTTFLKIVYQKTEERYIEWKRIVQQLTKNDTEWYSQWRRVVQQVTTRDNEWQLAVISANFPIFRMREELNHLLYREHFIPWGEPIELRAETNP